MSWKTAVLLAVVTLGCAPRQPPAPVAPESTPNATEPPVLHVVPTVEGKPRPVVSVGQPLNEAVAALAEAQAADFSANVGTFRPGPRDDKSPWFEDRWFLLRGRTCLCVLVRTECVGGPAFVDRLTLGEDGRGYPGKLEWRKQPRRDVSRLELP